MSCFWLIGCIGCILCLDVYQYGRSGWGICHVSGAILTKLQLPPPTSSSDILYLCVLLFLFCCFSFLFSFLLCPLLDV